MPVEQRQVFAQVDGEVIKVLVEGGANVKKGQELLRLKNDELETQLLSANSELTEQEKLAHVLIARIKAADNNPESTDDPRSLRGQLEETKIKIIGLTEQIEILKKREEHLSVRSPIDGVVATFQVEQKLQNRPVQRGEALIEVMADHGQWHLELEVEEHRMGHLLEGQQKLEKRRTAR